MPSRHKALGFSTTKPKSAATTEIPCAVSPGSGLAAARVSGLEIKSFLLDLIFAHPVSSVLNLQMGFINLFLTVSYLCKMYYGDAHPVTLLFHVSSP